MGDYENKRLVVFPADDLVSILNNIGDNTEVILAEGTHTANSTITLNGLTNVSIRGSTGAKITSSLTSGALFDIDGVTNLEIKSFELTTALQSGDIFNIGGANVRLLIELLDVTNSPASGSADFFDISGITAAQDELEILYCTVSGDIASFFNCATAHGSATSVTAFTVRGNLVDTDSKTADAVVLSNSSDGVINGCRFDNNTINGFVQGFTIAQTTNCVFIANAVLSCGSAATDVGIEVGAGCSGLILSSNSVALQTGVGYKTAGGTTTEQMVITSVTAEGIVITGGTDDTLIAAKLSSTGTGGTYDALQVNGGTRLKLFNVEIVDSSGNGIHIPAASTASSVQFGQCTVHNPGSVGVYLEEGTDHTVSGCRISASGAEAIRLLSGVLRTQINGNSIFDTENSTNGIDIQEGADNTSITNNLLSGVTSDGINCDADGALIQGNFVINASGNGIEIGDTGNATADVTCQGNVSTGNGSAGLAVRATNSVIVGNLTYSNTGQGIYEHSVSSGNLFVGNKSHSNTGADSQYDGSNRSFGVENAQYESSEGESSTTSATYQTKVTLTSQALTGVFEVRWSIEAYVSNTNKLGTTRMYNNTDATELNSSSVETGNYLTHSGGSLVTFAGAAKTFYLQYNNDSNGTTYVRRASIELWKVK